MDFLPVLGVGQWWRLIVGSHAVCVSKLFGGGDQFRADKLPERGRCQSRREPAEGLR